MMRGTSALVAGVLCAPGLLRAQGDSVARRHDGTLPANAAVARVAALGQRATFQRAVVHYGKWLAAGGAVAFTVMGAHEHAQSNREFNQLLALCRRDNANCLLGADGTYVDPAAEQQYQSSIHFDRRARLRLMAGQATLLVAAGLFIADLTHRAGGPVNKPFAPLKVTVDERTGGALVGVRVTF